MKINHVIQACRIVVFLALVSAGLVQAVNPAQSPTQDHPNVLLIITDQQQAGLPRAGFDQFYKLDFTI